MEHSVPIFLTKLYAILQENSERDIIRFDETGKCIQVMNEERLVKYLLPEYFGHCNLPSFLR